jgi:hypothetical protein
VGLNRLLLLFEGLIDFEAITYNKMLTFLYSKYLVKSLPNK